MSDKRKDQESDIPNPLWLANIDQAALAENLLKLLPKWQEAMSLMIRLDRNAEQAAGEKPIDPFGLRHVIAAVLTDMTQNPVRYMELQQQFWEQWMSVYTQSMQKLMEGAKQNAMEIKDRRFKNAAWTEHPFFDFLRQSYGILSGTLMKAVDESDTLPPRVRAKLQFFTRQLVDALSPANNPLTNPEVLEEIAKTNGQNIISGLNKLIDDLKSAQSTWMVSSAPKGVYQVGRDLAVTPGSVVFKNEMMELIQYTPTTAKVNKTPLVIMPPWINKYYILDLRAENSFVKWCVDQGHTVFLISWKNPGSEMRNATFDHYFKHGLVAALNEVEKITGEDQANVIGYCIGGTLLSMALSYLKTTGQDRAIKRATFLTTLIDFRDAGDLSIFIDEDQIENIEAMMEQRGYLDGEAMKATFAMLRANDMIWSYVINNYWMGREPQAFDMLIWNADTTNLPACFHSDYLRSMYAENRLVRAGDYHLNGVPVDIRSITTPSYFLSAKDDHIAPWKATYRGMRMFHGQHVFTLAGSGHVAGVVNPPEKKKYGYWTSESAPADTEEWMRNAQHNEGSWWPHWSKWVSAGDDKVAARQPEKELYPAPGQYVTGAR